MRLKSGREVRIQGEPWALSKVTLPPVQTDDPNAVLAHLSAKEKGIVTTEYENRRLEWAAIVGNKCPHVRLAKRLRSARTMLDTEDIFIELSKYFVEPNAVRAETRPMRSATKLRPPKTSPAAMSGTPTLRPSRSGFGARTAASG